MASVAKWLRQRFVVPPLVGSIPIVRPNKKIETVLGTVSIFLGILTLSLRDKIARKFLYVDRSVKR
jgi:hypothetical protein